MRQMLDESLVDLQYIDLEVLQLHQCGVAGAEMIDRDAYPERPEFRQLILDLRTPGKHRFGYFQFETGGREPDVVQYRWNHCDKFRIAELPCRAIDRDAQIGQAL